jgi:hypothetical protein
MTSAADALSDRSLEASAMKRGAPLGPRLLPVVSYDDGGMLTTYTGKMCGVCGCQLTSRNRYGKRNFCMEHGREKMRERDLARITPARHATTAAALRDPCPHRQAVHRALTGFLNHPTEESIYAHFIGVMRDYELRARLMQAIPRSADDHRPSPPLQPTLID